MSLLIRNARVLLACDSHPHQPLRGCAMDNWPVLDRADVLIVGSTIAQVGKDLPDPPGHTDAELDAQGRVLMPAFVDCHTHACWAGNRYDEWDLKRSGVSYLDILNRGGGIMSTVRAVRAATQRELKDLLAIRLARMLALGSSTIEVKSGYGLSTTDELKMLRAIFDAAASFPGTVVPTALIGHALDTDAPSPEAFVKCTIEETLPAIHAEFPGVAIDAYCEHGAWSLADCRSLFDRARSLGHPIRVHADQFNNLGIVALNAQWCTPSAPHAGFRSIDHLEASDTLTLAALAATPTIGTLLPCAGFHIDGRYANGRALIDAGGAVALATNANPGSAPCFSMQMAIALAVRCNQLTVREALAAATVNAACVLGLMDRGVVCPGTRANLALLSMHDERQLAYEFGDNQIDHQVVNGALLSRG